MVSTTSSVATRVRPRQCSGLPSHSLASASPCLVSPRSPRSHHHRPTRRSRCANRKPGDRRRDARQRRAPSASGAATGWAASSFALPVVRPCASVRRTSKWPSPVHHRPKIFQFLLSSDARSMRAPSPSSSQTSTSQGLRSRGNADAGQHQRRY